MGQGRNSAKTILAFMHCSNCGVCCTETEMLLSKKDLKRLEETGYKVADFASFDKQGYVTLKNRDGYCIFYDLAKRKCSVYTSRPSGCRVYPVIVDIDSGVVLDTICECRSSITEQEKAVKGKRVVKLLEVIDAEAAERKIKNRN
jgi:Fe-S-cluster containining protein